MKTIISSALAVIGLAMAPVAAHAGDDDAVSYDDAMKCSALFAVLAAASDGDDTAELEGMVTRWLVVAMDRDGTEDGSKAEGELDALVDELIDVVDGAESEEEAEAFFTKGIEFCEGKHEQIAEEIDGIELD